MKYLSILLLISTLSFTSHTEREVRLALLIGNGDYSDDEYLKNPTNDARDLGKTLQTLGFDATIRTNRNLRQMKTDINTFCNKIREAKSNGNRPIIFFYYSGHGMQIGGVNYLIPVKHDIVDQADVADEAYPMNRLLRKLQLTDADVNIIVMDACRNNPFEKRLKGQMRHLFPEVNAGLADIKQPTIGTLVAYATAPGKTANDGDSTNSPYAAALIKYLPQKGYTIEKVFKEVRNKVYTDTRETQLPWETSSLMGDDLYLNGQIETGKVKDNSSKDADILPDGIAQLDMVYVEGGTFQMGSGGNKYDEKPAHSVTLNSFYISKYETTVAEFRAFVNATNYKTDAERNKSVYVYGVSAWTQKSDLSWYHNAVGDKAQDNHPVIYVSWNDATAYCEWRTKVTGENYRLPTEAEWEYAARGGKKSKGFLYAGSNKLDEVAWYRKNSHNLNRNHKNYGINLVGLKVANELGLYDMSGNVWEWCQDRYDPNFYTKSGDTNPLNDAVATYHCLRGGSWGSEREYCRVSNRGCNLPQNGYNLYGFRCVKTL